MCVRIYIIYIYILAMRQQNYYCFLKLFIIILFYLKGITRILYIYIYKMQITYILFQNKPQKNSVLLFNSNLQT